MVIFDNQCKNQPKRVEVSFDEHLEVYELRKPFKSSKKHVNTKKRLASSFNNNTIITVANTISNDNNGIDDKENFPGKLFTSEGSVGILINGNEKLSSQVEAEKRKVDTDDIERVNEINYCDKLDVIRSNYDKNVQNLKSKYGSVLNKQENEFHLVVENLTDQGQRKSAFLGKNMEDILEIFSKRAPINDGNKSNDYFQMNGLQNNLKNAGENLGPILLQRVHHENKHDFLSYMEKEYSKLLGENRNQLYLGNHLQSNTLCDPVVLKEQLPDEENNYMAYCGGDISMKVQEEISEQIAVPLNMNVPKSVTKCSRNSKSDSSDIFLEFRCKEARRQSELDIVKFKNEGGKTENLIPVEKGLFSNIISFDNDRKKIVTDAVIDHAKKTGSFKFSNKSLINITDLQCYSDSTKESKLSPESAEVSGKVAEKWRSVIKTVVNLNRRFIALKPISQIENSVCSIKELRLINNRIEELPGEIGDLQFLSYLNLSYNHLKALPLRLSCLKNLEEINLRRNFLERLPETFGNLVNLQKADLSFNKMTKLPASFVYLCSLTSVDLSFNKLIQLPMRLMYLKKLENANISCNYLSELPPMVDMKHLVYFDSTCNRLRHFPNFSGCIRLTELRLGVNQIKEILIENLYRCPLINFILPHNRVEVVPDDISVLTSLEILDVSDNLISILPWTLAKLQHLTHVKIENNKITNVKKPALEETSQSILEILRTRLILYEGKDSPILKQIAEKEKKERREWGSQEDVELKPKEKKKRNKKTKKITVKGKETPEDGEWNEDILRRNEQEDIQGMLDSVLKKVPQSQVLEFKRSLTAQRILACSEMKLSDLSVNLIKVASHYKVFKVDLSKNNFSFVPIRLRNLFNHLRELNLSGNNLKTIPDFFGSMSILRKLDVSHNQLDSFPLSMSDCNIKSLNARNNSFTKIPKALYSIKTLEHVNFSRNKIRTIDISGIKNWKKLSYLNLKRNFIEEIPCELGFISTIRVLDLSENPLKDLNPQALKRGTSKTLKHLRDITYKKGHGDLKNITLF